MALQAELSSPVAEKAALVSTTRLFFFTALFLFQMGARPDPCQYDQQTNIQDICNLSTILSQFQWLATSSRQVENTKWFLQFIKK